MSKITKLGFAVAAVLVLIAALSPLLASWERVQSQDLVSRLDAPDRNHPMGRDQLGRDELARIIYGARVSMLVGLSVVTISSIVGVLIGSFSGYAGGWTDRIVSGFLFNVFLSFPGILLAIAMVAFLGPSLKNLVIALSVIGWVGYARLMRAQVLKVREYDFQGSRVRFRYRGACPRGEQRQDTGQTHSAKFNSAVDCPGIAWNGRRDPGRSRNEFFGVRRA
jgi:peptide/nickel transport system permease protein